MTQLVTYLELSGEESAIDFDVVLREVHTGTATMTEHAVEDGAPVSDHVRQDLDRLTVEFVVSNQPIRLPRSHMSGVTASHQPTRDGAMVLTFSGEFDRRRAVYEELARLKRQAIPCRLITELREYESMVILSLEVPREVADAEALRGTLEFKQLRVVAAATATSDPVPAEPRARRRRRRGSQAAGTAGSEDGTPLQSVADRGLARITSFLGGE